MKFIKDNWAIILAVFVVIVALERWNASYKWKDKYNDAQEKIDEAIAERGEAIREANRLRDGSVQNAAIVRELRRQLEDVRTRREEPIIIDETISDTELAMDLDSLLDAYRDRPTVRP